MALIISLGHGGKKLSTFHIYGEKVQDDVSGLDYFWAKSKLVGEANRIVYGTNYTLALNINTSSSVNPQIDLVIRTQMVHMVFLLACPFLPEFPGVFNLLSTGGGDVWFCRY